MSFSLSADDSFDNLRPLGPVTLATGRIPLLRPALRETPPNEARRRCFARELGETLTAFQDGAIGDADARQRLAALGFAAEAAALLLKGAARHSRVA